MTIDSIYNSETYSVRPDQTYTFTFEFSALNFVEIYEIDADGNAVRVDFGDYSVIQSGGEYPLWVGGTVTVLRPHPAGTEFVEIKRNTDVTQLIDYDPYRPFPAETHEFALDKITQILQEHDWDIEYILGVVGPTNRFVLKSGDDMTGNLNMLGDSEIRVEAVGNPTMYGRLWAFNFGANVFLMDANQEITNIALRAYGPTMADNYDLVASTDGCLYWRGNCIANEFGVIFDPSTGNFVTIDTEQTITGEKNFHTPITFQDIGSGSGKFQQYMGTLIHPSFVIRPEPGLNNGTFTVAATGPTGAYYNLQGLQDGILYWRGKPIANEFGVIYDPTDTGFVTLDTDQTITGEKTFTDTILLDTNGIQWAIAGVSTGTDIFAIFPNGTTADGANFQIAAQSDTGAPIYLQGLKTGELYWNGVLIADTQGAGVRPPDDVDWTGVHTWSQGLTIGTNVAEVTSQHFGPLLVASTNPSLSLGVTGPITKFDARTWDDLTNSDVPSKQQILQWSDGGEGIPDAPSDGNTYGRKDGDWVLVDPDGVQPPDDVVWTGDHNFNGPAKTTFNAGIITGTASLPVQNQFFGPTLMAVTGGTTTALAVGGYVSKTDARSYTVLANEDVPNWAQVLEYGATLVPPGGGEANSGVNVGTGTGEIFRDKTGVDLNFRKLLAGNNILISTSGDDITIESTAGGGSGVEPPDDVVWTGTHEFQNASFQVNQQIELLNAQVAGSGFVMYGTNFGFGSTMEFNAVGGTDAGFKFNLISTVAPGLTFALGAQGDLAWNGNVLADLNGLVLPEYPIPDGSNTDDMLVWDGSAWQINRTQYGRIGADNTWTGAINTFQAIVGNSLNVNDPRSAGTNEGNANSLLRRDTIEAMIGAGGGLPPGTAVDDLLVWDGTDWLPDQTTYSKVGHTHVAADLPPNIAYTDVANVFTAATNTFQSVVCTTINGNDFRSSDTVASPANALLRRDIIEAMIAAAIPPTGNFVTLDTAQTITGQKTFNATILASGGVTAAGPVLINASNPPTAANEATRKDYVDAQIAAITVAWGDITGKPSTFPPSAHTHGQADITGGYIDLSSSQTCSGVKTFASIVSTTANFTDPRGPSPSVSNQLANKSYVDTAVSDIAAKDNITPLMLNAMDAIKRLNPFTFSYKPEVVHKRAQHKVRYGLSANELQEVLPEAVHECEGDNEGLLGADYAELVPVLIKALQEQQEQIEELRGLLNV